MNSVIKVRRSYLAGTPPQAGQLEEGQLAVNIADRLLYIGDDQGGVVDLNYSAGAGIEIVNKQIAFVGTDIVPGTFTKVTVNAQGMVTAGADITGEDITILLGYTPYDASNPSGFLTINQNITISGDATGSGTDAIDLTLAVVNAAVGTFGSATESVQITVDDKGRITDVTQFPIEPVTNQTITLSGDATGSGETAITVVLADSGVDAGIYTKVNVDAKGRVVSAGLQSAGDITTALGFTPYNSTNPGGFISANEVITISGDATGNGATDIVLTLAPSGVTAGSYAKVNVDAKGRVTSGGNLSSGDVTTALGYTPMSATGGDITGTITISGGTITGLPIPSAPSDAASKDYVDTSITSAINGVSWKMEAKVATAGDIVLSGLQVIDGYTTVAGERVLVKNQSTGTQNGVYIASAGVWTRAADVDTGAELFGMAILVLNGTASNLTQWVNSNTGPITLGSTNIVFAQLQGAGTIYSAGTGLALTGSTFSLTNTGVVPSSYTKVTVDAQGRVSAGANLSSGDVTTALGFTPYSAANPSGFLTTNQTITVSGDVTGSGANALALTLVASGVGVGTYTKVTVDIKGRVTAGASLASGDVIAALGFTPYNAANPNSYLTANQTITYTGDVTGSGNVNVTLSLAPSGAAAGTYTRVTVDTKGRVTSGGNLLSTEITAALGYTPVNKVGDSMSGTLTMTGGFTVTGLPTPSGPTDAASKDYVDTSITSAINGVAWKAEAKVATTANITLSGLQVIDGYTTVTNDRVLVKNQTTPVQNGVYAASVGGWLRTTDADTGAEVFGMAILILNGTANGFTQWVNSNTGIITLGSTNVTFAQLQGAGILYSAGTGLALTGSTFSLANTAVTPGTYTKVTVDAQGRVTVGASLASGDITTALGFTPVDKAGDTITGSLVVNGSLSTLGNLNASGGIGAAVSGVSQYGENATDGAAIIGFGSSSDVTLFDRNAVARMRVSTTAVTASVPVVLPGDPTTGLQAATKQYVDAQVGAGGVVSSVAGRTGAIVLVQADIGGLTTASSPTFTGVSATTITASGVVTCASVVPTGSGVPVDGMFLPAAHTVALATNSLERLRISSSGAVGIGLIDPDTYITAGGMVIQSATSTGPAFILINSTNDTTAPFIGLRKNRAGATVAVSDNLGGLNFSGWDGTSYVISAQVNSVVDSATATGLVPGRLTFSTFQKGGPIATLSGITGGSGYTNGTYAAVNLTGGNGMSATADITVAGGAVTVVTLNASGFDYRIADALSATTAALGAGTGFVISVATITAPALVTRMRIDSRGNIGVGIIPTVDTALYISKPIAGANSAYGVRLDGAVAADVKGTAFVVGSLGTVSAGAETLNNMIHFAASPGTWLTRLVNVHAGFYASPSVGGKATSNYGFWGALTAAAGNWNVYAGGTAQNFFLGNVGIGSGKTAPAYALDVNGTVNATLFIGAMTGSSSLNVLKTGDTMSGNLTISQAGAVNLNLDTTVDAQQAVLVVKYNGNARWRVGKSNNSETGSNVGSDFNIGRYNDAGTFVDTPLVINRTTGVVTLSSDLLVTGNIGVNGAVGNLYSGGRAINLSAGVMLFGSGTTNLSGQNVSLDAAGTPKYVATAVASTYTQVSGGHLWNIAASGTAGATITWTQAMTLGTTGNLLIGTVTDNGSGKLQVTGATNLSSTLSQGAVLSYASFGAMQTVTYTGEATQYGVALKPATSVATTKAITFLSSTSTSGSATQVAAIEHLAANAGMNLAGTWTMGGAAIPSVGAANSWTATQSFPGVSTAPAMRITNATEVLSIVGSAPASTQVLYVASGAVQYYTTNATANWTINFAWSAGTSMNTAMTTGDSVTVAFMAAQGASPFFPNAFQIDGSSVSPKWQGGTVPVAGNASGIDVYTFTIIKTASATYTILASQTQFK